MNRYFLGVMGDIKIVQGGISTDFRGAISHVNDLDMSESGALLCHTAKRSVDHPGMARTSNGEEVVLRTEGVVHNGFREDRQLGEPVKGFGARDFSSVSQ